MAKQKTEWEVRREQATKSWKAMTPHQQQCVLDMLAAWVPVRTRVGELCSIDYDDLRAIDTAWWKLKNAIVDNKVQINEWDY